MNIFIDANVLVSVLNKEYPLFTYTSRILSLHEFKGFKLFTSPLCLAIAFYFASKKTSEKDALKKISTVAQHIYIAGTTEKAVANTVNNKKILDFEDGLEYYSALESKCTCIVTENLSDFHFAEIEVLNSQDFMVKYVFK